ncbi:hypothetical protein Sarmat_00333 [Rickettsiales endosymbiont of Paramecium tredecaurelia]|uniref:hypothetical protein n=1 Tax=Candidatus Sarmatiella mevalonica TaxID=2770581 RepID=UPI00192415D2|nr:hypothetical protein [Candidatus Sarmatiella mevalonica]MBL3284487.1 hypothetical protein [Candidatus Sarmatiella mevalonica]
MSSLGYDDVQGEGLGGKTAATSKYHMGMHNGKYGATEFTGENVETVSKLKKLQADFTRSEYEARSWGAEESTRAYVNMGNILRKLGYEYKALEAYKNAQVVGEPVIQNIRVRNVRGVVETPEYVELKNLQSRLIELQYEACLGGGDACSALGKRGDVQIFYDHAHHWAMLAIVLLNKKVL